MFNSISKALAEEILELVGGELSLREQREGVDLLCHFLRFVRVRFKLVCQPLD